MGVTRVLLSIRIYLRLCRWIIIIQEKANLEIFHTQRFCREMAWRNASLNARYWTHCFSWKYAQDYYLKETKKNLTETVKAYKSICKMFPLMHPSPLNRRWMAQNPWFEKSLTWISREHKVIKGQKWEQLYPEIQRLTTKEHMIPVSDLHTVM